MKITVHAATAVRLPEKGDASRRLFADAYRWVGPSAAEAPGAYAILSADERKADKAGRLSDDRTPLGRRVLNQLSEGGEVNLSGLRAAHLWCSLARNYYLTTEAPLPVYAAERVIAADETGRAMEAVAAILGQVEDRDLTVAVPEPTLEPA